MKLHYYVDQPNFGDALNGWLWDRVLPGWLDDDERVRVSGIGTLLSADMPPAERWIILTSGVGYGRLPAAVARERWTVVAVRGPLSARTLALPPSAAVTDGAILLATLPEYAPLAEAERRGIVFVPHHRGDPDGTWRAVCASLGIEYLDPRADSHAVVARLRRAAVVLAEAMHAAIIADSLRVPWVPVATSREISTFKWLDWTLSMGLPCVPVHLPAPAVADWARGALLPLTGGRHAFAARDEADALAHLERRDRLLGRPWWPLARRTGKRVSARTLRALRRPSLAAVQGRFDDRLADRAAAALAAAAKGPRYLSADHVFADRRDELMERIARFARSAEAGIGVSAPRRGLAS